MRMIVVIVFEKLNGQGWKIFINSVGHDAHKDIERERLVDVRMEKV